MSLVILSHTVVAVSSGNKSLVECQNLILRLFQQYRFMEGIEHCLNLLEMSESKYDLVLVNFALEKCIDEK